MITYVTEFVKPFGEDHVEGMRVVCHVDDQTARMIDAIKSTGTPASGLTTMPVFTWKDFVDFVRYVSSIGMGFEIVKQKDVKKLLDECTKRTDPFYLRESDDVSNALGWGTIKTMSNVMCTYASSLFALRIAFASQVSKSSKISGSIAVTDVYVNNDSEPSPLTFIKVDKKYTMQLVDSNGGAITVGIDPIKVTVPDALRSVSREKWAATNMIEHIRSFREVYHGIHESERGRFNDRIAAMEKTKFVGAYELVKPYVETGWTMEYEGGVPYLVHKEKVCADSVQAEAGSFINYNVFEYIRDHNIDLASGITNNIIGRISRIPSDMKITMPLGVEQNDKYYVYDLRFDARDAKIGSASAKGSHPHRSSGGSASHTGVCLGKLAGIEFKNAWRIADMYKLINLHSAYHAPASLTQWMNHVKGDLPFAFVASESDLSGFVGRGRSGSVADLGQLKATLVGIAMESESNGGVFST